jgi:hypothetical protein
VIAESASPNIPTFQHWPRPASRMSAPCTGRACLHRPPRRRTFLRRCSRPSARL